MKSRQIKKIIQTLFISILTSAGINAQTPAISPAPGDSLALGWIIHDVIQNHPLVQAAAEELNKADAQIGLAKSGYYPNIDLSAGFTNVGPVPSLTIPDMGSFSLFPRNNISGELNVHQNIYDFKKTSKNVLFAGEGKALTGQALEQVKQNLAMKAIQTYYSLNFLQEAIKIKAEQLKTLNEHLDFVERKKATGSATDYEILSTKVKISGTENQQLDLEAAREVQLSLLNSLLGQPAKTFHNVKSVLNMEKPATEGDSLITHAIQYRSEMQMAKKKEELAALRVGIVKSQNNPSLNFIANGGWKNGYFPNLNKIRPNYVVGVGLNVPLFDGTRAKYNLLQAQSAVETSSLETEIMRRNISGEVVENETNIQTALKKVKQAQMQLEQAQEALSLAQVSYKSGVITNLDMLDAATAVSESRLMLLKSQIDYVVNVHRLKASLGEKLY